MSKQLANYYQFQFDKLQIFTHAFFKWSLVLLSHKKGRTSFLKTACVWCQHLSIQLTLNINIKNIKILNFEKNFG